MPAQYEIPTAWSESPYGDLKLPSGGTVQVKRIDLMDIVAADLIDEFDKISPTVEEKVVTPAKGRRPADRQPKKLTKKQAAEKAQRDFFQKDNLEAMVALMDRLLPQIVVQPAIFSTQEKADGKWQKISYDDRVAGRIYVDSVPLADQMAIFGYGMEGMDMEDLQSFREQSESPVADAPAVQIPPDSTE